MFVGETGGHLEGSWMGHADIQTTMRYLHYAPRSGDADLVAEAFRVESATADTPTAPQG